MGNIRIGNKKHYVNKPRYKHNHISYTEHKRSLNKGGSGDDKTGGLCRSQNSLIYLIGLFVLLTAIFNTTNSLILIKTNDLMEEYASLMCDWLIKVLQFAYLK